MTSTEPRRSIRSRSRRSQLSLSALGAAGASLYAVLSFLGSGAEPVPENWLVAGSLVLTVYCCILAYEEFRRGRAVSPVSLTAMLYVVHFALPGLLVGAGALPLTYAANYRFAATAVSLAMASLVAVQGGSALFRSFRAERLPDLPARRWKPALVRLTTASLLLSGWAARAFVLSAGGYFQITRTATPVFSIDAIAIIRFTEALPLYAYMIILTARWCAPGGWFSRRSWSRAVLGVGLGEFVYWVIAGRKEEAILVLIFPVVARYLGTRRIPSIRKLIPGVLVIFLLFPATHYYRVAMQLRAATGGFGVELVTESVRSTAHVFDGLTQAGQAVAMRLNLLEPVSACVRLIEEATWERRNGDDYLRTVENLMPRFLWSGKPNYHYGTEFGRDAGAIAVDDESTSVSVTYLGESYLNFGRFGWLTYLLVGFVAEALYWAATRQRSPTPVLLYLLMLSPLLYIGGVAALYAAGFVKLVVIFTILSRILQGSHRHRSLATAHGRSRFAVGRTAG